MASRLLPLLLSLLLKTCLAQPPCRLSFSTASFSTTFTLADRLNENKPVYADGQGRYLYYITVNEQFGRWLVGDAIGGTGAWAYVDSFAANPLLIASASPSRKWMTSGDGGGFAADGSAVVECEQGGRDETVFIHSETHIEFSGFYSLTGLRTDSNGRVYVGTHQPLTIYAYHVSGKWVLGDTVGSESGWAFANSGVETLRGMQEEKIIQWRVFSQRDNAWEAGKFDLISGRDGVGVFEAMHRYRRVQDIQESFTLSNNISVPLLGFGTGGLQPEGQEQAIRQAMQTGYKLLDSASAYQNEHIIGKVLTELPGGRRGVFVATKVWPTELGFEATWQSAQASLQRLNTPYVDLFMLHWPFCYDNIVWMDCSQASGGTWQGSYLAMERLYAYGMALSLGVSNFDARLFREARGLAAVGPHVVQNFMDVLHPDTEVRTLARDAGTLYQAYSSLRSLPEPAYQGIRQVLSSLSTSVGKTRSQILLRYLIEKPIVHDLPEGAPLGLGLLSRTANLKHVRENLDLFGWELPSEAKNEIEREVRRAQESGHDEL